jgi:hypothetical protein
MKSGEKWFHHFCMAKWQILHGKVANFAWQSGKKWQIFHGKVTILRSQSVDLNKGIKC